MSFLRSVSNYFYSYSAEPSTVVPKDVESVSKVKTAISAVDQAESSSLAGRVSSASPQDIVHAELVKFPELSGQEVTVISIPLEKMIAEDERKFLMEITECLTRPVKTEKRIEIFDEVIVTFHEKYPEEVLITDEVKKQYVFELRQKIQEALIKTGLDPEQIEAQSLQILSCFSSKFSESIDRELNLEDSLLEISRNLSSIGVFTPLLVKYKGEDQSQVDQLCLSICDKGIRFSGKVFRAISFVTHEEMKEYQTAYCINTEVQFKESRFEGTVELKQLDRTDYKEKPISRAMGGAGGMLATVYDGLYSRFFSLKKEPVSVDESIRFELQKIPLFNIGNVEPSEIALSEILHYVRFDPKEYKATTAIQKEAFDAYAQLKEINPEKYPCLSIATIENFKAAEKVELDGHEIVINDEHIESLIDVLEQQVLSLFNSDVNRRDIYFVIGERIFEPFKIGLEKDKQDYCLAVYDAIKIQLREQGVNEKDLRSKALGLMFSTCQVFDVTLDEKIDLISKLEPIFEIAAKNCITISPSLANGNAQKRKQRDLITLKITPEEVSLKYDCHRSLMYVKPGASTADYVPVHLLYQYQLVADGYKGCINTIG